MIIERDDMNGFCPGISKAIAIDGEAHGSACPQLMVLSAASEAALDAQLAQLRTYLDHSNPALADMAYTLQNRLHRPHRLAVACHSIDDLRVALTLPARRRAAGVDESTKARSVFVFPGGGVQYPGMGRELYRHEPVFRDAVDACRAALHELGADDLLPIFLARSDDAELAAEIQPPGRSGICIFVYQYAMLRLLASIGLAPDMVLGHSLGEYTCAVASGALSLGDALMLLHVRGALLEQLVEPGAMLIVNESDNVVAGMLEEGTAIVALNGPRSNGVAGPAAAIDALARRLEGQDISYHRIRYGAASHCDLVEPVLPQFKAALASCSLRAPAVEWMSTVTARQHCADVVVDADYWCRQFREPVRFAQALCALADGGPFLFIEIGPQNGLSNLIKSNVDGATVICVGQHAKDPRDSRLAMLEGIGALWMEGADVTFDALRGGERACGRSLPELQALAATAEPSATMERAASDVEFIVRGVWQELFGHGPIGLNENFFSLGGHSLLAVRINSELQTLFPFVLPLNVQFLNPTIHGLACALVAAGRAVNVDVEAIAATMREVSEMSAHDFARLMQEQLGGVMGELAVDACGT
jgi:acyl transferase domain-containing protein